MPIVLASNSIVVEEDENQNLSNEEKIGNYIVFGKLFIYHKALKKAMQPSLGR